MKRKLIALSLSVILICQSVSVYGATSSLLNGHRLPVNKAISGEMIELP